MRLPRWFRAFRDPFDFEPEYLESEDVPMRTSEDATATEGHPVWKEIKPELHRHEFKNPDQMAPDFLRLLSRVRRASGVTFRIVSDHRRPEANPGATKSAHLEVPCRAVDLRVLNNAERYQLVTTALEHGITRLGIYAPTSWQQETFGKGSGSVHLDASTVNPSERIWMSW